MASSNLVRLGIIGCGGMARHHLRNLLKQQHTSVINAICEPSAAAYEAAAAIFTDAGLTPPPNQPDFQKFVTEYADQLDAVFIITPHSFHHDQTKACLEAGWDVLLEKPMVMNAAEARSLIEARDRTGKLLVVAFPGSLSPQIRTAVNMLRSGEFGSILNISAVVWQDWSQNTKGTWRQEPDISGGGFLFDTGAHMLNTVSDLAGEGFVEVAAWMDNRNTPVDILAAVIGRLESGALVTMNACGEAIPSCHSDIRVFCQKGIVHTGIWGEYLESQPHGATGLSIVEVPPSLGVWEQFLDVRNGVIPNPGPPEVGLRMALLWDAIKASAAQNGVPVRCV